MLEGDLSKCVVDMKTMSAHIATLLSSLEYIFHGNVKPVTVDVCSRIKCLHDSLHQLEEHLDALHSEVVSNQVLDESDISLAHAMAAANEASQSTAHRGIDDQDMIDDLSAEGFSDQELCTRLEPGDTDPFANEDELDETIMEKLEQDSSDPPLLEEEDYNKDCGEKNIDRKYISILKQYFGHSTFKPVQWRIIDTAMNCKRDQCVVMATGYGKSLCYQFTSVYTRCATIVISPLISLMEDQVLLLRMNGIEACQISSSQEANHEIKQEALNGKYRLIYMTPECATLALDFVEEIYKNIGLDIIAVDEAHCVSQWGHDFRSAYRGLGVLKTRFPGVPLLAMTATATPAVRKDICRSLKMINPLVTCTGFDRPNLFLSVVQKSKSMMADFKTVMCQNRERVWSFEGSTVIYCPTKKAAERCSEALTLMGINCRLYHAGLPMKERSKAHKDFVNDKVPVIIATVAFGMGIDKRDVRRVIHYGAPKDIESYYQEIGRAGRDGDPSQCIAFYSPADFALSRLFLQKITNPTHLAHKQEMMRRMEQYLYTTSCRRREILSHFEDQDGLQGIGGKSSCCDNCRARLESDSPDKATCASNKVDVGVDVLLFLYAVKAVKERFGMTTVVIFLKGSKVKQNLTWLSSHPRFASGAQKSESYWKALGRQLIMEELLSEVPVERGFGVTVRLSDKGNRWLESNKANPHLEIVPNSEISQFLSHKGAVEGASEAKVNVNKDSQSLTSLILPSVRQNIWRSGSCGAKVTSSIDPQQDLLNKALYEALFKYRQKIAEESELALSTYMIATNKNLLDLVTYRPTTMEALLRIDDLPQAKAAKMGGGVLALIKKFCQENGISTDLAEHDVQVNIYQKLSTEHSQAMDKLSDTARTSYMLFQCESKVLEAVAVSRGLKPSTIVNHLCDAIEVGLPVAIDRLDIPESTRQLITETVRAPPVNSDISRLGPIKEKLPFNVTFDQIKVVLAILKYEYGVTRLVTAEPASRDVPYSDDIKTHTAVPAKVPSDASAKTNAHVAAITQNTSRDLPMWLTAAGSNSSSKQPLAKKKKTIF